MILTTLPGQTEAIIFVHTFVFVIRGQIRHPGPGTVAGNRLGRSSHEVGLLTKIGGILVQSVEIIPIGRFHKPVHHRHRFLFRECKVPIRIKHGRRLWLKHQRPFVIVISPAVVLACYLGGRSHP